MVDRYLCICCRLLYVPYLQKSKANSVEAVFKITPSCCELLPGERIQVVIEGCINGSVAIHYTGHVWHKTLFLQLPDHPFVCLFH